MLTTEGECMIGDPSGPISSSIRARVGEFLGERNLDPSASRGFPMSTV